MELLDCYFELQDKIYEYFGYKEDWRVIPLRDNRDFHWWLSGEVHGDFVRYAITEEKLRSGGDYGEDMIYTQRHLPKWVYRGEEYTIVCCDPGVDRNQFLRVFSNALEHKSL